MLAACIACLALVLSPADASAKKKEPLRPGEPVSMVGARLDRLLGEAPQRIVAFRFQSQAKERKGKRRKAGKRGHRRGRGRWVQIPVQVDERKVVDFGLDPSQGARNPPPGVDGTVYGTAASGYTALQYTDPHTFVGADSDPSFDPDDELTFMAADSGGKAPRAEGKPRGVRGGGATRVRIADPLGRKAAYVYLYRSKGKRKPAAGKDYVSYDFRLLSGDYRSTYERADGPNPESSVISTRNYEIGFSDRWFYDRLQIKAERASGADILDGFKFSFGPDFCGRSEATFNDAEGAFVANVDGPVRAIRSYVGANSGPRTERTHFFYGDRQEIVTDLRVHPVAGPLIYHDLSAAGAGMSFQSSSGGAPVTVDGSPDEVSAAPADWQLWSGAGGGLFAADRVESSFGDALLANASLFYLDDSTPPHPQCWGDSQAFGQAGFYSTTPMPNTDPGRGPAETLQASTTEVLGPPSTDAADAARWSKRIDSPLRARAAAAGRSKRR